MSGFSEEGVQAKLSSLNETQESIVTVAAWISFHKRNAQRSAEIWLSRLKESGAKRLNLIYLANEIVQQAKHKRKEELVAAFSPLITEGTIYAYKNATSDVQNKLKRVVEVWRSRVIFHPSILDTIEAKIDEMDKSKSSGKRSTLGGSLFSASAGSGPPELAGATKAQVALSKSATTTSTAVPTAETEYTKLTDPSVAIPTPPVYAARLSALLKSLSAASTSLSSTLEARKALIASLETLLSENKASLEKEEGQFQVVEERRTGIEAKKREVEDGIMRGLSAETTPLTPAATTTNGNATPGVTVDEDEGRPDVEALTPPPTDDVGGGGDTYEPQSNNEDTSAAAATATDPRRSVVSPHPAFREEPAYVQPPPQPQAGADLLSSLMPGLGGGVMSPNKKRKLEDEHTGFGGGGDAMAGLDEDVAELLRQERGGGR